MLIIEVITGKMGIMQSLNTRMGILSMPGALLLDIEDIMLPTMAGSTSLNENCSVKGYCLGVKRSRSQSNPNSFAKSLILSTALLPTEAKKLLNSSATVCSS